MIRRLMVLGVTASMGVVACGGGDDATPVAPVPFAASATPSPVAVVPFANVAASALKQGFEVWNDRPGVAVFDYDRDGDLDFYITAEAGHANWLYRNDGDGTFTDVAEKAGVAARTTNSTGVVACDLDNDGYQDLYVGAWGSPRDGLGFRSPSELQGNKDLLFRNNGDGTFVDITDRAFGDAVNIRSATTIACADVDNDGWLDIYVGNLADDDFRDFQTAHYPGHYNLLYRNNGDLTFTEIAERAGVRGPQIVMRDPDGRAIFFEDPETGEKYEGYDPTAKDRLGNRVGEPTGQTHAVMFFDYDDDGDADLWVANDGDRLHVYRNDSTPGNIRFTPVERAMGIDKVGAWMGFALGDFDGDSDLDVFVTNIGYHLRLHPPQETPGGSCGYHEAFSWGTCLHFLLRNNGTRDVPGIGTVGHFFDVAPSTSVVPSPLMPPESLDPSKIHRRQEVPTGLAAYDFGFGTTFFDYDNDGDQDLYWLGSTIARGEAPRGDIFASAGRMLRGDGQGSFEDITVRAHLLDIVGVDYTPVDVGDLPLRVESLRISDQLHENGKGLAHGDLNGDGYVDLIATNSSGDVYVNPTESMAARGRGTQLLPPVRPAPGPVFVWVNGGGDNHWITLRLKGRMAIDGTGSNADGVGARVYVKTAPPGGGPRIQVQEVHAGSSYLSMDSIDLEFGVGTAQVVDEITVLWPSGRRQVLKDLSVDQVVMITEPER
ncbi:MAG: CRTAC1 family protein [Chloroflexi bacterium]|nr:CRTAC1 family protein [Chloroflexota bacterium]